MIYDRRWGKESLECEGYRPIAYQQRQKAWTTQSELKKICTWSMTLTDMYLDGPYQTASILYPLVEKHEWWMKDVPEIRDFFSGCGISNTGGDDSRRRRFHRIKRGFELSSVTESYTGWVEFKQYWVRGIMHFKHWLQTRTLKKLSGTHRTQQLIYCIG